MAGMHELFGEGMEKVLRDRDEFTLFFNAIGLWLNQEIDTVNSNSGQHSIDGASRRALIGETGFRKLLTEPTFELRSNDGCTGFVRLSLLTSSIETEIDDPRPAHGNGDRTLNFRMENTEKGAKAFRLEIKDGNPIETELQAQEVAKIVVDGVVRGYFV